MVDIFRSERKSIVALYDINSREDPRSYGVVDFDGRRIISMSEKPERPSSTIVSTGIYMFPKETLRKELRAYVNNPSNQGRLDAPGHFISYLVREDRVLGHVLSGIWHDIGNLYSYRLAFDRTAPTVNHN